MRSSDHDSQAVLLRCVTPSGKSYPFYLRNKFHHIMQNTLMGISILTPAPSLFPHRHLKMANFSSPPLLHKPRCYISNSTQSTLSLYHDQEVSFLLLSEPLAADLAGILWSLSTPRRSSHSNNFCLGECYHGIQTNSSSAGTDFQSIGMEVCALGGGRIFALHELLVDN